MSNAAGGPGFFGKLPCLGDFVRRRLPDSFVVEWDRHFERAMAASQDMLGESWPTRFTASPVWRFVLPENICGEAACVGVMGPSRDRVGRWAPLVIAAVLPPAVESATNALIAGGPWFAAAARTLRCVLAERYSSVESFDDEVAALSNPFACLKPMLDGDGTEFEDGRHWRLPLPEADGRVLAALWRRLAASTKNGCLWWTPGSRYVPPCTLVTPGLPQADAYAAFLDATQCHGAWRSGKGVIAEGMDAAPSFAGTGGPFAAAPASDDTSAVRSQREGFATGLTDKLVERSVHERHPANLTFPADADRGGIALLLRRPDCGLTVLAAQCAAADPRQQALAQIRECVHEFAIDELATDPGALRKKLLGLHAQLSARSESLVDPVTEDCAVLAVRTTANRATLFRIGDGMAWLWRDGGLQSCFPSQGKWSRAESGEVDDFDDLLSGPVPRGGLGSGSRLVNEENTCDLEPGDRVLLLLTPVVLRLAPSLLARGLTMPDPDAACARIAAAAGLGEARERWPLTIVELPK